MIKLKSILTEQATESYEIGGLRVSEMMATSTTSEGNENFKFKAKHTNTDSASTNPDAIFNLVVQQKNETTAGLMYTIFSMSARAGKDKIDVGPFIDEVEGKITRLGTKELFTIIKR